MQQQLLLLVALQDVDEMIRETRDPEQADRMAGMGYKMQNLEALEASRQKLVAPIEPRNLAPSDRVAKRVGRAVVPEV